MYFCLGYRGILGLKGDMGKLGICMNYVNFIDIMNCL